MRRQEQQDVQPVAGDNTECVDAVPNGGCGVECIMTLLRTILEELESLKKHSANSLVKEWYTVEEVAARVGRRPWTVRQWCNEGRAEAKKVHGKGRTGEWRISHEELKRLQSEEKKPAGTFENGGGRPAAFRRAS